MLQLRLPQFVPDGIRAGEGRLRGGLTVPRLRGGSSGPEGTMRQGGVFLATRPARHWVDHVQHQDLCVFSGELRMLMGLPAYPWGYLHI